MLRLENHNFMKHFVFLDCAAEVLKGSKQHKDIPHGAQATISCTGGCIHFTKVISYDHPVAQIIKCLHTRPCLDVTMFKQQ